MAEKLPRRNFLARLGLLAGGSLLAPFQSVSKNLNSIMDKSTINPIKKVRPLGFQWETADPFLFCVHHEDNFPKGNAQMGPDRSYLSGRNMGSDFIIKDGFRMYHGQTVPGFPGHPHRGFETITVVRKGYVDHADSMGAAGRYGNGDVQWMTAGGGVQHSEMFPLLKEDKPNPMELFQIWLNLPKKSKMVEPHFKMFWHEDLSVYKSKDGNTKVEIIAGSINGHKAPAPPPNSWAADPANHVAVLNIKMDSGSTWTLPKAAPGSNRTLYYYEGEGLQIAGEIIPKYNAVEVEPAVDLALKAGKPVTIEVFIMIVI